MNITNADDKIIKGTYQSKYEGNVELDKLVLSQYLNNEIFEFVDAIDKKGYVFAND